MHLSILLSLQSAAIVYASTLLLLQKKAFLALLGPILSRKPKTFMFFRKKWSENLEGVWKVHTFASAFEQNAVRRFSGAEKKEFFEKIT